MSPTHATADKRWLMSRKSSFQSLSLPFISYLLRSGEGAYFQQWGRQIQETKTNNTGNSNLLVPERNTIQGYTTGLSLYTHIPNSKDVFRCQREIKSRSLNCSLHNLRYIHSLHNTVQLMHWSSLRSKALVLRAWVGVPYLQAQLAEKRQRCCRSHCLCRLPLAAISYTVYNKSREKLRKPYTHSKTEHSNLHNRTRPHKTRLSLSPTYFLHWNTAASALIWPLRNSCYGLSHNPE